MFEVGDIVKVREDLEVGKEYGNMLFRSQMMKYLGKEVVIDRIVLKEDSNLIGVDNFMFWLSEEMLIPLSKVEDDEIPINEDIEFYIEETESCDRFEKVTEEMSELYAIKNANYGNSFSEQFKEYGMTSVCIRLDDKLRRLKSLNNMGSNGTNDESTRDTLIDLANYSVMAIMELDNKEE